MKSTNRTYQINKTSAIIALVLVTLTSFFVGYSMNKSKSPKSPTAELLRQNSHEYKLINPLLLAGDKNDNGDDEYKNLESKINNYILNAEKTSEIKDVSVYFRDLNSGQWTGINENDKYAPGSMLKAAVLMGYLKAGEKSPGIMDIKYPYVPVVDPGQYFTPPKMLPQGSQRVGDLIKNMIINSDNSATLLLINKNNNIVTNVYNDLSLPLPEGAIDFMSAKSYSVLWRVLYNGTYLSKDFSEQALNLLLLALKMV